jgi:RsiG-like
MTHATGPGSRTDEVLDPGFVQGLEHLPLEELRRRRDQSLGERDFQSYLRRLVQVRQDILAAEHSRRQAGETPEPLIERLTTVLSRGSRTPGRGEALRTTVSQEDLEEADRELEALVPAIDFANPHRLPVDELAQAIDTLAQAEHAVSARRVAVLRVHDQIQDELKRRYREDPSLIPAAQ